MKMTGALSEIFKRTPKRYRDPVFLAWLEIFFTPKRHQFSVVHGKCNIKNNFGLFFNNKIVSTAVLVSLTVFLWFS